MLERCEDLFAHMHEVHHVLALSTNGTIKRNGQGVMGRGCALEASKYYPSLPALLGRHLREHGNVPGRIPNEDGMPFMILPVKHQWWQRADVDLVLMSVRYLERQAIEQPWVTFHVPRLGCGNGRLSWLGQVEPLMRPLPANVIVHH
jgi:hypothetical protein